MTYKRPAALQRALKGLEAQSYAAENWEILVIDNDSGNENSTTQQVCQKTNLANIRYIKETRTGLAYARNRGIQEAAGEYLIFLDDDALPCNEWILAYDDAYTRFPLAMGAGGPVSLRWEGERPKWLRETDEGWYAKVNWGYEICSLSYPRFPRGVNMSFKKSLLSEVGLFIQEIAYNANTQTWIAMDEAYVFDRIFRAGHLVIYVPSASVEHWIDRDRATLGYFLTRSKFQGVGDWRFLLHSPKLNPMSALAIIFLRTLAIFSALVFSVITSPMTKNSKTRALARIKLAYNYGYVRDALTYIFRSGPALLTI